MTPDVEFARMLHAAEQLSAERALVFTYDHDGWRVHPAAIYDPFENAPPIEAIDALERSRADSDDEPAARPVRRKPADKVAPCGTPAAYARHRKHGEPVCQPCRDAYRADQARRGQERRSRQRAPQVTGQSPLIAVVRPSNPDAQIYHLPVTGAAS